LPPVFKLVSCLTYSSTLKKEATCSSEILVDIQLSTWCYVPITGAARSKAWTVFAHSNTGIVGLNPTRGKNVCVHLFCVCVVLCVGSGLETADPQGVLPAVYRLRNWNSGQGPQGL
jgi:hypothetical protein